MRKKISVSMLIISSALLTLSGCSNQNNNQNNNQATVQVTESNPDWISYEIGIDNEYPPYVMKDEHSRSIGFDLEILHAIATNQKFNITSVSLNWDKLTESVESGKFDMALGGWIGLTN